MEVITKSKKKWWIAAIVLAALVLVVLLYLFVARPMLLKTKYKLEYKQFILQYAEQYDLEPTLVTAVIFCESSFRPTVVSGAGAVGLMQIMPATGEEIAAGIGLDDYKAEQLNEPAVNIQFGCYYLRKLLDRFSGNEAVALAAYNAGPSRAQDWMDQYGLDSAGALLYIPYPETDKYVDRVLSAKGVYTALYGETLGED